MKWIIATFALSVILCPQGLIAQQLGFRHGLGPPATFNAGGNPYRPDDPWVRGYLYRVQTGHSGFFYNCDHQEDKRFSPYIEWGWEPPICRYRHPLRTDIHQQLHEVRQRICWGAGNCAHAGDRLPPGSGLGCGTEGCAGCGAVSGTTGGATYDVQGEGAPGYPWGDEPNLEPANHLYYDPLSDRSFESSSTQLVSADEPAAEFQSETKLQRYYRQLTHQAQVQPQVQVHIRSQAEASASSGSPASRFPAQRR